MLPKSSITQFDDQINNDRRNFMLQAACVGTAVALPGLVCAKAAIPNKIHLVIPYPPGGSTDTVGRILASSVGKHLDTSIISDNQAGAAGLIGIGTVARSAPDGATLGISGIGTTVLLALTQKDVPYNRQRDLDVIAHLGSFGNAIVARSNAPFNNFNELLAFGKEKPGFLTCGTSTLGSPSHMTLEYLKISTGINVRGIPYRGDTQILTDVLGGQLQLGLISVPQAIEQVKSGTLKTIAVTSAKRAAALPSVPTIQESGVENFEASLWNVLVTRKGVPQDIQQALNEAVNAAFTTDKVRRQLALFNIEFVRNSQADAIAFVDKEDAKWKSIVQKTGLTPS